MASYPNQGSSPYGDQLRAYIDEGDARSLSAKIAAEKAVVDAENAITEAQQAQSGAEAARETANTAATGAADSASSAASSASGAAASATEAQGYRDQAVQIVLGDADQTMAAVISEPGSATETALRDSIASGLRDGAVPTESSIVSPSGPVQRVLNVERQTIVSGASGDPVPMSAWDGVLYGNRGFSLYSSTNNGRTWTLIHEVTGMSVPSGIVELRPLGDGEVLLIRGVSGAWKSSGWATNPATATWSQVITTTVVPDDGVHGEVRGDINPWGVSIWNNYVFITEYQGDGDYRPASRYAWLSTDHGSTFTVVYDLNALAAGMGVGATTSHLHATEIDRWKLNGSGQPRLWLSHHDYDNGSGIGGQRIRYSDDLGATWTTFLADTPDAQPTTILATPVSIMFGSDGLPDGVLRVRRTKDGLSAPERAWTWRTDANGLAFICRKVVRVDDSLALFSFRSRRDGVPGVVVATDGIQAAEVWRTEAVPDNQPFVTWASVVDGEFVARALATGTGGWDRLVRGTAPSFGAAAVDTSRFVAIDDPRLPEAVATKNLFPDPSCERTGSGSINGVIGGVNATVTNDDTRAHRGARSARVAAVASPGAAGVTPRWEFSNLAPSTKHTFSLWAYNPSGNTTGVGLKVDSAGAGVQGGVHTTPLDNTRDAWVFLQITFTTGSTVDASNKVRLWYVSSSGGNEVTHVDDLGLAPGAIAVDADGDEEGWEWTGTPYESTSVRLEADYLPRGEVLGGDGKILNALLPESLAGRTTTNGIDSASGDIVLDTSTALVHRLTLTGNVTSITLTNPVDGREVTLSVQQGATGNTVAWPTNARFAGGSAPALSAANRRTTATFRYSATLGLWMEISRAANVPTV